MHNLKDPFGISVDHEVPKIHYLINVHNFERDVFS